MPQPIAFRVFGFPIRWYGILISLGITIGIFIAMTRAKKKNIVLDELLDILIVAIPCAIIGARLYYVAFSLDYYLSNPKEIFAIWHGGLAIHGGLIGGIIGGYIVCRIKKLHFFQILDIFAPCFPIGQAIGRWGNYFNQEAYGGETNLPWAITVNDPIKGMIKVHPTFFYEFVLNIFVFLLIIVYEKKVKKVEGELICIYGIAYSLGRAFIEGFRTDSLYFMGFRTAQLISAVIVVVALVVLIALRKGAASNEVKG